MCQSSSANDEKQQFMKGVCGVNYAHEGDQCGVSVTRLSNKCYDNNLIYKYIQLLVVGKEMPASLWKRLSDPRVY